MGAFIRSDNISVDSRSNIEDQFKSFVVINKLFLFQQYLI